MSSNLCCNCNKTATLKCICGVDFYCNTDCQKAQWPDHKNICKNIRNKNVLDADYLNKCSYCNSQLKGCFTNYINPLFSKFGINNIQCSACKTVTYCSKLCKSKDWTENHNLKCKSDGEIKFKTHLKLANTGITHEMFSVALSYHFGFGVELDLFNAFKWYERAANLGHGPSMFNLATCYNVGIGIDIDTKKGFEWTKRSAETGFSNAQHKLSTFYKNGECVEENIDEALKWAECAAKQDHLEAQYNLGMYYYETDKKKAMIWIKRSAMQNNSQAQYYLGKLYLYLNDTDNALKWIDLAAKQNQPNSQMMLAVFYMFGQGVKLDKNKAYELLDKAVENGYEKAYEHFNLTCKSEILKMFNPEYIEDID
jgi:hypothetical protein